MYLWISFIFGLVGSGHCMGMCGPIAISLPYRSGLQTKEETFIKVISYNLGRILVYMLMGAIFGIIGKGFFTIGIQRWTLIVVAFILLFVALFSIDVEYEVLKIGFVRKFNDKLKVQLSRIIQKASGSSFFYIGILNGFLPCGLVYMALVSAISLGSVYKAVLYMMFFGLGTIPVMVALGLSGNILGSQFKKVLRKLYPVVMVLLALFLLYRAYNFGNAQ